MGNNTWFLALDPSTTSLGYSYRDPRTGGLVHGVLTATGDRQSRFACIMDGVESLVRTWTARLTMQDNGVVIYYRPFARGADATRCLWGTAAIIEAVAANAGLPAMDAPESAVRSTFELTRAGKKRAEYKADARLVLVARGVDIAGWREDEVDATLLLFWAENSKCGRKAPRAKRSRAG